MLLVCARSLTCLVRLQRNCGWREEQSIGFNPIFTKQNQRVLLLFDIFACFVRIFLGALSFLTEVNSIWTVDCDQNFQYWRCNLFSHSNRWVFYWQTNNNEKQSQNLHWLRKFIIHLHYFNEYLRGYDHAYAVQWVNESIQGTSSKDSSMRCLTIWTSQNTSKSDN